MGIDPITMAAIGSAGSALGDMGSAALSSPPNVSSAGADSYQAGVNAPFGNTYIYSTGNIGSGINYSMPLGPLETDFNSGGPVTQGSVQQGGMDKQTLLLLALGGVAIWLLLKK